MDSNHDPYSDSNLDEESPPFDLREFLLDLSEKGEIDKQPAFIKKASEKNLEKIYQKYKLKQLKDTNEMICDMIIVKTGDILETIGWIKSGSETSKKLQKKKLFMRDFSNLMAHITPYIPFLGFVEGGISIGEDVATHAANTMFFPKPGSSSSEEQQKVKEEEVREE